MRYDITNIPVAEMFEQRDGCPICRIRNMLEERAVEYITGAAMMEPDIRMETNKQGFCLDHYQQMIKRRNRLSVALMLESHLDEIAANRLSGRPAPAKRSRKAAGQSEGERSHCYICTQLEDGMQKMLATVCRTWEAQRDFQRLFEEQPCLCLPHFTALAQAADIHISKKERSYFVKAASNLAKGYLENVRADVHHFCEMYDYRNAGENADWGNSKDAIERAVWYLTGRSLE